MTEQSLNHPRRTSGVQRLRDTAAVAVLVLAGLFSPAAAPLSAEPLLEPFPEARVEARVPISSPSHRVMLSPVREVNDQIRSRSMIRVGVDGTALLQQVNAESSRGEARQWYRRRLQDLEARILFQCEGRDCGRSNVWANQIFGQATLYGRDADQDYLVAASRQAGGTVKLFVLYTVTRGNQRDYLWLEELNLEGDAVIPGFTGGNARILGPMVISWSGSVTHSFDWNASNRRTVSSWMDESGTRVVLGSYTSLRQNERWEDAMERAQRAAASMAAVLERSGVPPERLLRVIVGPAMVSDSPTRQGDRIELLGIREPGTGDE